MTLREIERKFMLNDLPDVCRARDIVRHQVEPTSPDRPLGIRWGVEGQFVRILDYGERRISWVSLQYFDRGAPHG